MQEIYWETQVQSLSREDSLEEGMATHSSTPAWRIPWTEKPGRLQSTGSQRIRHDWSNLVCRYAHYWGKTILLTIVIVGWQEVRRTWLRRENFMVQFVQLLKHWLCDVWSGVVTTSRQPSFLQTSRQLSARKTLPQPEGGRICIPRVHQTPKHGSLCYRNKLIPHWQKCVDYNSSYFD